MAENVTDRGFTKQVLQHDGPVLVTLQASWCQPSLQLVPVVDEVAAAYGDRVKMVNVDVETEQQADGSWALSSKVCQRYNVTRLPVVMLFNEGRLKDLIGGFPSKEAINEMLDAQLRPVIDVDDLNFQVEVLDSKVPVLIHVHAAWCAPSLELLDTVETVAQDFRGRAKVVRLEFGPATARLCARYGIRRVPTLAVMQDGKIKDQILGAMKGGTKTDEVRTSCVNLTTSQNIAQMLESFVAKPDTAA